MFQDALYVSYGEDLIWEISVHGNTQKPSRHSRGQPALDDYFEQRSCIKWSPEAFSNLSHTLFLWYRVGKAV